MFAVFALLACYFAFYGFLKLMEEPPGKPRWGDEGIYVPGEPDETERRLTVALTLWKKGQRWQESSL